MAGSYGKIPKGGRRQQPAISPFIEIKISGRHTLEQLSMELQKAVARLQEHGVYGVQQVRMRLQPLDENGEPIALWTVAGKQIETLHVPDLPPELPYRVE